MITLSYLDMDNEILKNKQELINNTWSMASKLLERLNSRIFFTDLFLNGLATLFLAWPLVFMKISMQSYIALALPVMFLYSFCFLWWTIMSRYRYVYNNLKKSLLDIEKEMPVKVYTEILCVTNEGNFGLGVVSYYQVMCTGYALLYALEFFVILKFYM